MAAAAKSLVTLASVSSSGSFLRSPGTPQDDSIQSIRYDPEGFWFCFVLVLIPGASEHEVQEEAL